MIRLCILDHDAHYAEAMVNFLSVRYSTQVELSMFRSLEALQEYLRSHRLDLVLASVELLPDPAQLSGQAVAYLSEDRQMERINGCPAVFRYQRGESLMRQIKGIAAETDTRNVVYATGDRGEAWVFMGAGGGMGTTTAAVGCAAQMARMGRKVLYLCLQSNGCISGLLSGEGTGGMARVLYEVKTFLGNREGMGNLAPRLEGLLKYDAGLQVYYYDPFQLPLEAASLQEEEAACLLTTLIGAFEVVVVDVDGVYGPLLRNVLDRAGKIVLVSSGTESANTRMQQMLNAFAVLDESEDLRLMVRTRLLYNRFGSDGRQAAENRAPVLGMIHHYSGADGWRILQEIRRKDLFLPLLNG